MAMYRDRTFDPTPFAGSIGDLILRSAEAPARAAEIIAQAQARAAEVKGQAWAQAGQGIGNIPAQIQQMRDANVERKARQAQLADADAQRQQAIVKRTTQLLGTTLRSAKTPDEAKDGIKYLVQQGGIPAEAGGTVMALLDSAGPDGYGKVQQHFLDLMNAELPIEKYNVGQIGVQGVNADGTPNVVVRGPEKPVAPPRPVQVDTVDAQGNPITQFVDPTAGASYPKPAPPKPEPKRYTVTVDDGKGNPVERLVTEDELANGVPVYRAPRETSQEPLVAIMGPDNQPVLVPRSQAVGKRPASNREQGRPVTSGDANRIADMSTSLNAAESIADGVTDPGTLSVIQSWVPNWANEVTGGWSDDAKSQNAIIALVRQIIGKALEGGVLRKEDEVKYRDILPQLGESKALVKNKLAILQDRIEDKRSTLLDSLEDSGYDVTRHRERVAASSVRTRARDVLQAAGKASDAAAIDTFLKNNPEFK